MLRVLWIASLLLLLAALCALQAALWTVRTLARGAELMVVGIVLR